MNRTTKPVLRFRNFIQILLVLTFSGFPARTFIGAHSTLSPTRPIESTDETTTGFGGAGYAGSMDSPGPLQREIIWQGIQAQVALLKNQSRLAPTTIEKVALRWPLRPAHGLADNSYYIISHFVDHDPAFPNHLLDYHGGMRTYDSASGYNHAGTDIVLWPFAWDKMNENQVEVVAAAPGVIVTKTDGNYDRNCALNENREWNAVYIRHADGSIAWYGHLKSGSLTPKNVGESVAEGEYLGVVGSSGNSDVPHLHFELYDETGNLTDPYSDEGSSSWWVEQMPYYDPAINRLATMRAKPVSPACQQPETTNIEDSFMPGTRIYFLTYYRDVQNTQESIGVIYRPDGTVFETWTQSFATIDDPYYPAYYYYWWWNFPTDAPIGTWRFEVNHMNRTYSTYFNIGDPTAVTVTSPNGGEQWDQGLGQTIRWNDNLGGDVTIKLYRNGDYHSTLVNATASIGSYLWFPAVDLPVGSGYTIRVIDTANPSVYAESNGFALVATALTNHLYLPQMQR